MMKLSMAVQGSLWSLVALLAFIAPSSLLAQSEQEWKYDPKLLQPFWNGDVVEGETVLFIRDAQTGKAQANLLFPVAEILSVRNSKGDVSYELGKDLLWTPDSRSVTLPEGSRIISRLPTDLRRPAKSQKYELTHRDGNGEILFGKELEYAESQTCITYRRKGSDLKSVPKALGREALPKSIDRLKKKEPFRLVVLGDSISEGANASGMYKTAPFQPAYPELVRRGLSEHYVAPVELTNLSVGGRDSAWGITQVESVLAAQPHLVVIAFGMNDSAGRSAIDFKANIAKTMELMLEKSPETEFVLVATMTGNRDWVRLQHELFPQYRDVQLELRRPGVVVADLTSLWMEMLERKMDWDLTGNGVNHPNDFGHRVYAQVVLAHLMDP